MKWQYGEGRDDGLLCFYRMMGFSQEAVTTRTQQPPRCAPIVGVIVNRRLLSLACTPIGGTRPLYALCQG